VSGELNLPFLRLSRPSQAGAYAVPMFSASRRSRNLFLAWPAGWTGGTKSLGIPTIHILHCGDEHDDDDTTVMVVMMMTYHSTVLAAPHDDAAVAVLLVRLLRFLRLHLAYPPPSR
jgi:hypothetical protein